MMRIACLLACISTAMVQECSRQPAHEAFCAADWVSHVKVINVNNPYKHLCQQIDIVYTVEHLHHYKMPESFCMLPPVLRATFDESVRLNMAPGKEYLLAGNKGCDMTLHSSYCAQVNDDGISGVQEWQNVSEALKYDLESFQCYHL
uniref:NTR domain-containing protein n=1 Tax=Angiostrongylus cantonensis TaxID=6313 RepID=A0A0K0CVX7_ANGCA